MIPLLETHRQTLDALCRRFGVSRLEIFGSAAAETVDRAASDLDFLVAFDKSELMSSAEQYFGLLEALQELFGREVDLLTARSLRNPYFIREVERSRELLYAA